MIYANTGQPGAGKTLGAIEFVLNDDQFKNRAVYVYGIKGINVEGWTVIDLDQVLTWWTLPEGSVVIIDECQDIWRPRGQGKAVPEHVQRLEKHRHLGFDFVLTFQFPAQIDTVVRHLVTDHFHYHRAMGLNARTRFHWDFLCLDPMSKSKQDLSTNETRPFNKKIYDLYDSASMHTAKARIPKFVYLLIPLVIAFIALMVFLGGRLFGMKDSYPTNVVEEGVPISSEGRATTSIETRSEGTVTALGYLELRVARIENMPRSAPIYDELNVAKSMPRPLCLKSSMIKQGRRQCKCYSQQVTWIRSIDVATCLEYVKNGYEFDYTIEDTELNRDETGQADNGVSGAPFDLVKALPRRISAPSRSPRVLPRPSDIYN
jgi:zona occludens toxin